METDHASQENSDQVNQDQDHEQEQEHVGGSQVRSYECTFCKRGFSNAQALGGHMNIHRKHKAKLKHSSSNDQLHHRHHHHQQHAISKSTIASSFAPIPTSITHPLMEAKSSIEDRSISMIEWPWVLAQESDNSKKNETHVGEIHQLSLFLDKSSSAKYHHQEQEKEQLPSNLHGGTSTEKGLSSSHGLSSSELDLELRLGPEPRDSSPAKGTKRFI